jgi:predicted RNA-binding protein
MNYWIGVASKDHVDRGVEGGFCQLCHGKSQPLKRMEPGDWIIYYSPKEKFGSSKPYQQFTAIGKITGKEVYTCEMSPGFIPNRRDVEFIESKSVAIKPLIDRLSFIKIKRSWGYAFRFGHIRIPYQDFKLLADLMLENNNKNYTN